MGVLQIRTDSSVEEALTELTREGRSRSEVTREALLAYQREQRRARLRAEAETLRNDPEDRAEMQQVMREMDEISAW
ncbi:hypothetical protein [Nesterenkonia muleiensis]|uniref:hypothetical protein n=1 Tax=Nesterenkonia muleiensis TaxID=2282648 RepID=UPI000E7442A5|nr:hypothetical protein [Nesterenkonia muleiensis]